MAALVAKNYVVQADEASREWQQILNALPGDYYTTCTVCQGAGTLPQGIDRVRCEPCEGQGIVPHEHDPEELL